MRAVAVADPAPAAPDPAAWDRIRRAETHRYLLDLFTNPTFWVLVGILIAACVRSLRAGGLTSGAGLEAVRSLASSPPLAVPFILATVLAAANALYMSYEAPRDLMQDIASARSLLGGGPLYRDDLGIRELLEAEPARFSLGRWVPPLRRLETEELYWVEHVDERQAHPPLMTLAVAPLLAAFGVHGAIVAVDVLSLVALLVTLLLVRSGLSIPRGLAALMLAAAVLGWYPVLSVLRNGQPGLLIGALLVTGWFALRRGLPWLAGATIGVATCLKLYPGLLLAYLALRHRRAFVAALSTIAVLVVLPVPFAGWHVYSDYLRTIRFVDEQFEHNIGNVSLFGVLAPFTSGHAVAAVLAMTITGALVYLLSRRAGGRQDIDLEYALFLVSMLLLTPVVWPHYLMILLLPLAVVGRRLCVDGADGTRVIGFLVLVTAVAAPEGAFLALCYLARSIDTRLAVVLKFPTWAVAGLWLWLARLNAAATSRATPFARGRRSGDPRTVPVVAPAGQSS